MSIVDHNQDVVVPYSIEDTFSALGKALKTLDKFTIDKMDDILKIAHVRAGVSLFSWGENITVQLKETDKGTSVSVLSTPKTGVMFGGMMDMGKNRENINLILDSLSNALRDYNKSN